MDAVFKKLNYNGQNPVYCINHPRSFETHLQSIADTAEIKTDAADYGPVPFAIVFVTKQAEIDHLVTLLAPRFQGDAVLWMCYPKGSSKNYTCDFNRDTGWDIMGKYDLEGVRMVAIDADWSALRFRNVKYIKTLKRSTVRALSETGRQRTGQQ